MCQKVFTSSYLLHDNKTIFHRRFSIRSVWTDIVISIQRHANNIVTQSRQTRVHFILIKRQIPRIEILMLNALALHISVLSFTDKNNVTMLWDTDVQFCKNMGSSFFLLYMKPPEWEKIKESAFHGSENYRGIIAFDIDLWQVFEKNALYCQLLIAHFLITFYLTGTVRSHVNSNMNLPEWEKLWIQGPEGNNIEKPQKLCETSIEQP